MVAYSFKRRFVEPILVGLGERRMHAVTPKRQTIRADRKRHARPGEEIQLYCGMRTTGCFLIGKAVCTGIRPVVLDFARKQIVLGGAWGRAQVLVRQFVRTNASLDEFARADGFRDFDEMRSFWATTHGSEKFEGVLVQWEPAK